MRYPPAWLQLASMLEDESTGGGLDSAKRALQRYLEVASTVQDRLAGWRRLIQLCRRSYDLDGELHALAAMCQVQDIPFQALSDAVLQLNSLLQGGYGLDTYDETRRSLVQRVASIMAQRVEREGDATDCSRLAWLYWSLQDKVNVRSFTELGLAKDPENEYCVKLGYRFSLL